MRKNVPRSLLALLVGCGTISAPPPAIRAPVEVVEPDAEVTDPPRWVDGGDAAPATWRRLTDAEWRNANRDLLGVDTLRALDADAITDDLLAVGAAWVTTSELGVERYEDAVYDNATRAIADPALRAAILPCAPTGPDDEACAAAFAQDFGLRAWRRPLTADEADTITWIVLDAGAQLDSFDDGLVYGVAALLQSPHFLYRLERGERDPKSDDDALRLTDWELATRLGFLLWGTTPDRELLRAAGAGELSDDTGLGAQVDRMLSDPRARRYSPGATGDQGGLASFFDDAWGLWKLRQLQKDAHALPFMTASLGDKAREQTLRDVEHLVFTLDGDFRSLFTTTTTWIDRELAAVYDVPAPSITGFGLTELPPEGRRRGVLGQASFLALQAHTNQTSPTLRGKFILDRLLCAEVTPPPVGVDTVIPEPNGAARTLRERLGQHVGDPSCKSCHGTMDPIGFAFEGFDAVGHARSLDNGAPVDTSGDLFGAPFADAWDMQSMLASDPRLTSCFVKTLYTWANARSPTDEDAEVLRWLHSTFAWHGYRIKPLLRELIVSPAFRRIAPTEPDAARTAGGADTGMEP